MDGIPKKDILLEEYKAFMKVFDIKKEMIMQYCTDKSNSLDDRWKLFNETDMGMYYLHIIYKEDLDKEY